MTVRYARHTLPMKAPGLRIVTQSEAPNRRGVAKSLLVPFPSSVLIRVPASGGANLPPAVNVGGSSKAIPPRDFGGGRTARVARIARADAGTDELGNCPCFRYSCRSLRSAARAGANPGSSLSALRNWVRAWAVLPRSA
jgi:hypothetical protein